MLHELPKPIFMIVFLICFMVVLPVLAVDFSGGTGDFSDPYQIATAEQLIGLGEDTNLYDKYFVLVADIDLNPIHPSWNTVFGIS